MEPSHLAETLALEKKRYLKLNDVLDLTRQMAQALDRQDSVTIRMLLSMRQTPIYELQEIGAQIELKQYDLEAGEVDRFRALLAGEVEPEEAERPLAQQTAANRRLLARVVELDREVNRKLAGERSCYKN